MQAVLQSLQHTGNCRRLLPRLKGRIRFFSIRFLHIGRVVTIIGVMKDLAAIKELACDVIAEKGFIEHAAQDLGINSIQIREWATADPSFRTRITRAQDWGMDALSFQLTTVFDRYLDVQRARGVSDNLKWLLAKYKPDKYGDRQHITIDGDLSLLQARMVNASERVLEGECEVIESAQLEDLL